MRRLRRLVRNEAGYSLVEALIVMVILGTILAGVTTAFVSGSNAELRVNRRVEAQLQAAAAFDRLRRDVHCASSASIASSTITLSGCASGSISWCTVGSGSRYGLYRLAGSSCNSSGKLYADYLISSSVFTYAAHAVSGQSSMAKVHADVQVNSNANPAAHPLDTFELADDIVLRNSTR